MFLVNKKKTEKLTLETSIWFKNSKMKKKCTCVMGDEFFLGITKRCIKQKFFKLVSVRIEKQVSKVRKSLKLTFEILIWVRKCKFLYFSQKMRAWATWGKFCFGLNQKMRQEEFFMLDIVRFQKQVSEAQKNKRTNIWYLGLA